MPTKFWVNGEEVEVTVEGEATLILALRNELGLRGTRFGCGEENCGACTVLINGTLRYSCSLFVQDMSGRRIVTVEGLEGIAADELRTALIEAGAGQCGYCMSGIFVTAYELLSRPRRPSMDDVKLALSRHLCRCGAHAAILRAIAVAIERIEQSGGYDNG